jgi:hypothetical protein
MPLLHIHREILTLAAKATTPPQLPPPAEIEAAVESLVDLGLLAIADGAVVITPEGLAAVESDDP